jgi:hypothetical protein
LKSAIVGGALAAGAVEPACPTGDLNNCATGHLNYYAIVNDTSTGEGAFELVAHPQTGAVFPEMGPNMMWNTE